MRQISPINRAINQLPKRAEKNELDHLHETFVDSGVADALDNIDNQVLYGRRGTGKTHAFSYLASEKTEEGDLAILIDLRTIGSPDGIIGTKSETEVDRATRLLIDVLGELRESILNSVLNDDSLVDDDNFVEKIDHLLEVLTNVEIRGEINRVENTSTEQSTRSRAILSGQVNSYPSVSTGARLESGMQERKSNHSSESRHGSEQPHLHFKDITQALRELGKSLTSRRVWLFIDEWISIPRDLQPYLAEFLVRCIFPIQAFTVKIAAIEQHSNFMKVTDNSRIGIELGADAAAFISLDDYMVYEGNEDLATEFFGDLIHSHVSTLFQELKNVENIEIEKNKEIFIRQAFTDIRAFKELVRSAEGVPRDFISIASRSALRARTGKISVDLVREAARSWYQEDKLRALQSRAEANELLNWIIEKVIREKQARAFLVSEEDGRDPLLLTLFDARVLHVVRRGYSAQDHPGERFDVWSIDYGAYVDLIHTKKAPTIFPLFPDSELGIDNPTIEVPEQDLRAIRRAILNISKFHSRDI